MDWEQIGAIGELLGALAVFLTIFYLALQVRQSNNAARADSRQTLIDTFGQLMWEARNDDEFLRLISIGFSRWNVLTDIQKTRFDVYLLPFLSNLQKGVGLYRDGALDLETLDSVSNNLLIFLQMPGGRQWWKQTPMAALEVREYVDERLENSNRLPPTADEVASHWMRLANEQPNTVSA